MIYTVMVSISAFPFYAYEGKDKNLAIAIATSYIASGKPTKIIEGEDQNKEGGEVI